MALEGLIDQTMSEEDKALGTIDDLVNSTTNVVDETQPPAAPATPAEPAPKVAKAPAVKPDASSGIPTDLMDEDNRSQDDGKYSIDTDDGVSPELRADIKKQPQKTQDAFASMRIQIRELEKANESSKNAGLTDDEKEALINENKELQTRIEKADFVKSPRFQREFVNPINGIAGELIKVGSDYGISEEDMKAALNMPRADRASFLGEKISNQNGLAEILPMYTQYGVMLDRAKNAVENFNKEASASIAVERETRAKALAGNLSAAQDRLFNEGYTLLRESKANPDWLPNLRKEAAAIVAGEVDPAVSAESALRSVVAKHQIANLASQLSASKLMIADLQSKLSKYVKLAPQNNGNRSTNTPSEIDANTATIDDLVQNTIGG